MCIRDRFWSAREQVRHHEWIIGPNFGMVDFHLSRHGRRRPKTTRKCVSFLCSVFVRAVVVVVVVVVFCLTVAFQLLDKLWSQVSSLLPPGTCLQFLSRIGFSIPTARRFSSNVATSRSRAFRESICAQEKVPTNVCECALGGTRTHAIQLCLLYTSPSPRNGLLSRMPSSA